MNAVEAAVQSVRLRPSATNHENPAMASGRVMRLRERHHMMARMVASGMPEEEIARACGSTMRYLEMLTQQTPAFIQLVSEYRKKARLSDAIDTYVDHLERNMIAAEVEMTTRLIEDPESLSVGELHKIARDAADRLGFGKHSTTLNVNVDFAGKLEAARRRSGKLKEINPPSAQPSTLGVSASPMIDAVALPAPVQEPMASHALRSSSGQEPKQDLSALYPPCPTIRRRV